MKYLPKIKYLMFIFTQVESVYLNLPKGGGVVQTTLPSLYYNSLSELYYLQPQVPT